MQCCPKHLHTYKYVCEEIKNKLGVKMYLRIRHPKVLKCTNTFHHDHAHKSVPEHIFTVYISNYTDLYSLCHNYMFCNAKEKLYMVLVKNNNDIKKDGFGGIEIVLDDEYRIQSNIILYRSFLLTSYFL